MANALAPYALESLESKLCLVRLLPWSQLRHGQDEDPIAVGSIGQYTVDGLREDNLTVVWSNGPFREEDLWLIASRAAVDAVHGDPVAMDKHRNVLGFEPRHRRGEDHTILRLIYLHGNGLQLL